MSFIAVVCNISICLLLVVTWCSASAKIGRGVYSSVIEDPDNAIIVHFKTPSMFGLLHELRRSAHLISYGSERHDALPKVLKRISKKSQRSALKMLKRRQLSRSPGGNFTQLWALNKLIIHNPDVTLVDDIQALPEVELIEADEKFKVVDYMPVGPVSKMGRGAEEPLWNIKYVGAPEAWEQGYTGEGVVVGSFDSGVRLTHKNLEGAWRKEFGWHDTTAPGSPTPYDETGHGTHVIGTVLGRNGIGVAPKAKFIACKAIKGTVATSQSIYRCFQWFLCPTEGKAKNCSMRPDIIVNSWNIPGTTRALDKSMDLWTAANIIHVFSNGNRGRNGCSSVDAPAEYKGTIGVGSVNSEGICSPSSAKGPSKAKIIKPDVSAPGEFIASCTIKNDNGLIRQGGTSMAAPHVAGIAALLRSKDPLLNQARFTSLITRSAKPHKFKNQSCGGKPDKAYPNNQVGWGVVNAAEAIKLAKAELKNPISLLSMMTGGIWSLLD